MLGYVLWHWKRPEVATAEYEARQRAFHAALGSAPPPGFGGSFSVALSGAGWAAAGTAAFEDWYLVRDFAALGTLNDAAVSGTRKGPHDQAAATAGGGAAGVFRLRLGNVLREPRSAHWFSKPAGTSYADFLASLERPVAAAGGALWQRQMTLGPTAEFCLHAAERVPLAGVEPLVLVLRPAWEPLGGAAAGAAPRS